MRRCRSVARHVIAQCPAHHRPDGDPSVLGPGSHTHARLSPPRCQAHQRHRHPPPTSPVRPGLGPARANGLELPLPQGTDAYMAPEQCRAKVPGPASDTYGLGVTLFQALTRSATVPQGRTRRSRSRSSTAAGAFARAPAQRPGRACLAGGRMPRPAPGRPARINGCPAALDASPDHVRAAHVAGSDGRRLSRAGSVDLSRGRWWLGRKDSNLRMAELKVVLPSYTQTQAAPGFSALSI